LSKIARIVSDIPPEAIPVDHHEGMLEELLLCQIFPKVDSHGQVFYILPKLSMGMDYRSLVRKALQARKHSHSPYSGFRVGAALLTKDGHVSTGCNVENSSFSLTICAERSAIFKAFSDGKRKFSAIAVASDGDAMVSPCGACRQVLIDLMPEIDVVLSNSRGRFIVIKAADLLPFPFTGTFLTKQ
jgi:cytidine deaminase